MTRSLKKPPKLDLCKIDTARLRELSHEQLARVQSRTGRRYDLPAKPTKKWTKAHFLFVRFVSALSCAKKPVVSARAAQQRAQARSPIIVESASMHYIRRELEMNYPELFTERDARGNGRGSVRPEASDEFMRLREEAIDRDVAHEHRMRAGCLDDAKRYEEELRDAQEKAGCKLRPEELVARDAEKEGKHDRAAEARRSARRPRTPAKRIITKIR